jgi:hypothetical protein
VFLYGLCERFEGVVGFDFVIALIVGTAQAMMLLILLDDVVEEAAVQLLVMLPQRPPFFYLYTYLDRHPRSQHRSRTFRGVTAFPLQMRLKH